MKTIAKLGLVGLALAASSANADVAPPSSGNGELTLFVRNDTTGFVYARGLQITLDAFLTQAQINAGFTGDVNTGATQQLGYVLGNISADANLQGFLNNANDFSWTIMAGDSQGSNNADPARRYLTTTQTLWGDPENGDPASIVNSINNSSLITFSSLESMITLVNNNIAGSTVGDGGSTATNGQWRQTGAIPGFAAGDWFGAGPDTVNALGTAAHLYVLTTSGGAANSVRTYQGFDVILSDEGVLSAVVPAVPLPAAVWMLASGILTLAGVKRRSVQTAS